MSEEHIRKILRAYRAAPPAGTWERIAAGLDQAEALKKAARPVSYVRPAALLLLTGLLVYPFWLQQEEPATLPGSGSETIARAEQTPPPPTEEAPALWQETIAPANSRQAVSNPLPQPALKAAPVPDRPALIEPEVLPAPADEPVAQPDLLATEQERPLPADSLPAPVEEATPRKRSVTVVINLKDQTHAVPDSTRQSAPQKKPASMGSLLRELKRIKFDN